MSSWTGPTPRSTCSRHALHYGTGVFEGIRAYETARGPAVWHLDEHLRRLYRSAKLYHLDIPFSVEAVGEGMKDVIRANGAARRATSGRS